MPSFGCGCGATVLVVAKVVSFGGWGVRDPPPVVSFTKGSISSRERATPYASTHTEREASKTVEARKRRAGGTRDEDGAPAEDEKSAVLFVRIIL